MSSDPELTELITSYYLAVSIAVGVRMLFILVSVKDLQKEAFSSEALTESTEGTPNVIGRRLPFILKAYREFL